MFKERHNNIKKDQIAIPDISPNIRVNKNSEFLLSSVKKTPHMPISENQDSLSY